MQGFVWQVIDLGLLAAGLVCLAGFVIRLARTGRWRNPLADVRVGGAGPTAAAVIGVVLVFATLQMAASRLLERDRLREAQVRPGSDAWHREQCAGELAQVAVIPLMIAVLGRGRRDRPIAPAGGAVGRSQTVGAVSCLAAAIGGVLVLWPIANAQWELGRALWQQVHPEASPPVHPVLLALHASDWGIWGTVQLLVGAVVVAPVAEELFFRGVVLGALCRHLHRVWPAILLTAIAFGLIHVTQPQDVLPLVTMGVVLGYLRLRCGSLWPCIVLHALFNARTMIAALLAPELLDRL
jgi:membrane protease YdiL (CAAX protease family)